MITKTELNRVRHTAERVRSLEWRIQRLKDQVTQCTAQLTGMPHGGSSADRMAEYVAQAEQLQERYTKLVLELTQEQLRIERAFDRLPEQQARIMRLRYIDYTNEYSWRKISRVVHLSEGHCANIHTAALKRLREMEDNNEQTN